MSYRKKTLSDWGYNVRDFRAKFGKPNPQPQSPFKPKGKTLADYGYDVKKFVAQKSKIPTVVPFHAVENPGVFRYNGDIYVVKRTLKRPGEEQHFYAKKLKELTTTHITKTGKYVDYDFEWTPQMMYVLEESMRVPDEEAKDFYMHYGKCICCGKTLKQAHAIEHGMGDVCFGKGKK